MNAPGMVLFASTLLLLVACATGRDGAAGVQANRYVVFEGDRFGYYSYEAAGGLGVGENWRAVEAVITIVAREGRNVNEADRDIAVRLAQHLCEQDGREFNTRSQGRLSSRGGISFAGDCREW